MLLTPHIPRTKSNLIQLLQRQYIQQIEVIEPYDQTMEADLKAKAKAMSQRSGELTIILLRTS
jgi:hypothetical protein